MEIFGQTDKGCVRRANQDVFGFCRVRTGKSGDIIAATVCDGMGGAKSGEVASALALESFMADMEKLIADGEIPEGAADIIAAAVSRAGNAVFRRGEEDSSCEGMGTTLVAAIVGDGEAIIANVGDSRAYHISEGSILRVTRDHSLVEDMVMRGEITMEEARRHPSRNLITRALGTSRDEMADVFYAAVRSGDYLILCSDGLSNLLSGDELLRIITDGEGVEQMCAALIDEALERGAPDNVTVVVIEVQ